MTESVSLKQNIVKRQRDTVMVIYGRNNKARSSLFDFLRSIALRPLEWDEIVKNTAVGAPYIGDIVRTGFDLAHAALVLLTPDDVGCPIKDLWKEGDKKEDVVKKGQPRQNVLIETGMALALHPERTVIVQLGEVRVASDIDGREIIRLDSTADCRKRLAQRLQVAGCKVRTDGVDWLSAGDFSESVCADIFHFSANHDIQSAYLTALNFAKTIHHGFQELEQHGLQQIEYSCRTLFQSRSQGNDPVLIEEGREKEEKRTPIY